jgi:hypothetical protein
MHGECKRSRAMSVRTASVIEHSSTRIDWIYSLAIIVVPLFVAAGAGMIVGKVWPNGPWILGACAALMVSIVAANWLLSYSRKSLIVIANIDAMAANAGEGNSELSKLREIRQRRATVLLKFVPKLGVPVIFMVWSSWENSRSPLSLATGCLPTLAAVTVARRALRTEESNIGRENCYLLRSALLRPSRWRHRAHLLIYHDIYAALILLWFAFSFYAQTTFAWSIGATLCLGAYAEVWLPARILNDLPDHQLRKPRCAIGCLALSNHVSLNWAINAVSASALTACLATTFDFGLVFAVLAVPIAILGYHYSVRGVLSLLKWAFAGPTRILVFRRYNSSEAVTHRSLVLPAVGAAGYVVAFQDDTLSSADAGMFWESQDLMSGFFYQMPAGEPDWLDRVRMELECADFAVFDWESEPTDSMERELELAHSILPGDRLIWIISPDFRHCIMERLGARGVSSKNILVRDLDLPPRKGVRRDLMLRRDLMRLISTANSTYRLTRQCERR